MTCCKRTQPRDVVREVRILRFASCELVGHPMSYPMLKAKRDGTSGSKLSGDIFPIWTRSSMPVGRKVCRAKTSWMPPLPAGLRSVLLIVGDIA